MKIFLKKSRQKIIKNRIENTFKKSIGKIKKNKKNKQVFTICIRKSSKTIRKHIKRCHPNNSHEKKRMKNKQNQK